MTLARLRLTMRVIGQGQALAIALLTDFREIIICFYCNVIGCVLARRGVRRGAARASVSDESSACGRANAVGRSDLDRFFSFSSNRERFTTRRTWLVKMRLPTWSSTAPAERRSSSTTSSGGFPSMTSSGGFSGATENGDSA